MIDFDTCDALDRLHYDLSHLSKGTSASAKQARAQMAGWRKAIPDEVEAARAFCRQMRTDKTDDAPVLFRAAQSFLSPLVVILARMKAGEDLCVIDGRAALVDPETGVTHLGGVV